MTRVDNQKHLHSLGETASWRLPPNPEEEEKLKLDQAERDKKNKKMAKEEAQRLEEEEVGALMTTPLPYLSLLSFYPTLISNPSSCIHPLLSYPHIYPLSFLHTHLPSLKALRVAALVPISRCPICTLPPPCAHFFNRSMLDRFLGKIDAKAAEADFQAMEEAMKKATQELLIGMGVSKIMEKKTSHLAVKEDENARIRVMAETGLDDRQTDRNLTMVREYREREYMIRKGDLTDPIMRPII